MVRKHTRESLTEIVLGSRSYAECLRKMGLKQAGGNYRNLQVNIDLFNIDTSHMAHQAWNNGCEVKKFDDLIRPSAIKKRLIKERGYRCESCNIDEWMGTKIVLEMDHIDGNNRNNTKDNLRLLCPNCHSMTPTWRNRKR